MTFGSPKMLTAMTVAAAALAAANLWSMRQRGLARAEIPVSTLAAPRQPPPTARPNSRSKIEAAAPTAIAPVSFDPGLAVDTLLDASVELLCDGVKTEHIDFRRALPRGGVHLVNLFNVNCAPCIAEFPELADVMASAPELVRFVAVDTFEGGSPHESYRDARAEKMPPPDVRLAERLVDPIYGEMDRIARERLPRKPDGIPITFVIDCHQRLRWLKSGRIDHQEAAALKQLLAGLAQEGCARVPGKSVTEAVCSSPPPRRPPRISSREDCATKCKSRMCKQTPRGDLACDDSMFDPD